ncbi:MAG: nicotinate phosphoribosyltransferase [Deltaproteobacteria bacterium]|nr:nicotinate phosphoribosyltransferase [Deltaproteobacteria bacterium]
MTPHRILETDAYKLSMAEAGWPLREETFYYSHRRGGAQIVPFDAARMVAALSPEVRREDLAALEELGYGIGPGARAALAGSVSVRALPMGTWFLPGEPVFSATGPSARVSWLEPLVLQLHYRIQVATLALTDQAALASAVGRVTCQRQREIVLETLDAVGATAPPVEVDEEGYYRKVLATVRELSEIVLDPARIFEVGMRSASCHEQHVIALAACRDAGVRRTSNVRAASELGLKAVGTMGHEHVQRYGSDPAAFRSMRDRWPGPSSFLLDTFDTLRSGIPAAFELIRQDPARRDAIRYDSGDKVAQYRAAVALSREQGIRPVHILEDGFDAAQTRVFEALRDEVGLPPGEQLYGYGGTIVAQPPLTRDRVAAVWKLSQSGGAATMKLGDEAGRGKESLPGRPVLFRRVSGEGPIGIVGQEGEPPPEGTLLLTASEPRPLQPRIVEVPSRPALSPETAALVATHRERWRR